MSQSSGVVQVHNGRIQFGDRTVWSDLTFEVSPGEFLAVVGQNGSGKTTLLKVLLGLLPLATGVATICGNPPRKANRSVGYIPQQKAFDRDLPIRGRDLVRLGLDGHQWGTSLPNRKKRELVAQLIADVDATHLGEAPIGQLSGGEQQRLRIAQAIAGLPAVLLCDEPLLSLDATHQHTVAALINEQRNKLNTAVVFVTHEIAPISPYVDRVLAFLDGHWEIGEPELLHNHER